MALIKLSHSVAVLLLLLLNLAKAQQSCINTCTDSANVLTQLKSCSGCGTDDWACFCRCPQYMNALFSCVEENCSGSEVTDSISSFCADQGVGVSYSSGSLSINPTSTLTTSTAASSASTSPTASITNASELSAFLATAVGVSQTSFAATDTSGVSAYLASVVPSTAQSQSSAACFINSQYSYYSTPTWYTSLPTQAQSYYSSVNQGNTAACTLSPAEAAALGTTNNHRSGLSGGAIAGIVIGAILAALLLAALLWCLLRRRRRQRRNDAAGYNRSRSVEPRNMSSAPVNPQGAYMNGEKGLYGSAAPPGNNMGSGIGAGVLGANNNNNTNRNGNYNNNIGSGIGGGVLGANNNKQPNSFSTTTTTRTTIRSKPRKPAHMNQSSQARPPPQPIPSQALNEPTPGVPREMTGRRAF